MLAKKINENALICLMKQDWKQAQQLFFYNAKNNPSHETYNNLGNYLIDEGFLCKNGKVRNAQKLGLKYLLKAAELKESEVNLCTISKAYNYELRTASDLEKRSLYKESCKCLEKALKMHYFSELHYNILRIRCLQDIKNNCILEEVRVLVQNYTCEETVLLYLQLLCVHLLREEGLRCIRQYKKYLTAVDLLMFFSKFEMYDEGYCLCEEIYNEFAIDKEIASAVIECCVNTQHFEAAVDYSEKIREIEEDIHYIGKEEWCEEVFFELNSSNKKRRKIIDDYISIPPFIASCGYYGCTIHGVGWDD